MVKNLPAVQETQVQPLGWEDPLKKEMVTHSSALAGKSHGQRSLAGCSPRGCKELDATMHGRTCTHMQEYLVFQPHLNQLHWFHVRSSFQLVF